jgi:lambda repressor-like predicted transcriptional regulator
MDLDDILTALKAKAYETSVPALAKDAGISDDTMRRILSDNPPGWLKTYRRLEEMARAPTAAGAAPPGGE